MYTKEDTVPPLKYTFNVGRVPLIEIFMGLK
jgi:hypothetical protein